MITLQHVAPRCTTLHHTATHTLQNRFVIMTYAGAIPMLYMFGIIYFFTAYWGDKVAILRGCKVRQSRKERVSE